MILLNCFVRIGLQGGESYQLSVISYQLSVVSRKS
jgi:hypothetical protein